VPMSFYRSGLRLAFDHGKLTSAENWQPGSGGNEGDIAFPNLAFLQMLFGHRTLDELKKSYTDCWWKNDRTRMLITTLFPRRHSQVLGIS